VTACRKSSRATANRSTSVVAMTVAVLGMSLLAVHRIAIQLRPARSVAGALVALLSGG
jgi:hypothetical protein